MKHFFAVIILIAIVTAAVGFGLDNAGLLPTLASEEGVYVDQLFTVHTYLIAFFFALIIVLMVYSVIVFRRRPGDDSPGKDVEGSALLEVIWTIVPLGIVLALAGVGAVYLNETMESEPNEMVVEVTASQWSWRFDYPEFGVSSTELNLPVNQQVLFEFTSPDVVHSFWVPEFRLKQDVVPGITTTLRLKPTLEGEYTLRCAELCGLNHDYMLAPVTVMGSVEFEAWITSKTDLGSLSPEERGGRLVDLNGCRACHTTDGTASVGPSWLGTFGSEEMLDDGTTVLVDEGYILKSILDPNSQIVDGFLPNLMPGSFRETFSDEELNDLVAFIRSAGSQ